MVRMQMELHSALRLVQLGQAQKETTPTMRYTHSPSLIRLIADLLQHKVH